MKTVREIMQQPWTCREDDHARACAELMANREVGFVPVVDASNKLVGVVTDRDIAVRLVATGKPAETHLWEIMSRKLVTCYPGESLDRVEARMMVEKKSRILVTNDARECLGVVSLSDLARADEGARPAAVLREVSRREARIDRP